MYILWHIKEYMISATISGDVNLDDLAKVVSVWCLRSAVKLLFSLFYILLEGSKDMRGRKQRSTFWREEYHRVCGVFC